MQQVYLKTSETLRAEQEIIKYIQANRLPLEKKIPHRLFNKLMGGVRNIDADKYRENGIPFKFAQVEYTLKRKDDAARIP